jgi:glycolate oxidase FAD binding subunit
VGDAHTTVHAAGGTSALRTRPAGSDPPAWGPPPSALPVLQALKAELDPDGRFGPGRFAPWMSP